MTNEESLLSSSRPSQHGKFVYVLTFFTAIGGFLFGYDTGVVSGAMIILKEKFHLTAIWQEMIISITIGFAALFALIGGPLNTWLGRKGAMLSASVIFVGGSLTLALANTKETLLVGRGIVGAGIGIASMTAPMYIAEISPTHIRGRLVTFNNVMITFGQFVASCIDGLFSSDQKNGWRFMLGLAALPALLQLIGFIFLPESPRWLISKKRYDKAHQTLLKITGNNREVANNEFEIVKSNVESDVSSGVTTIVELLKDSAVRRALVVGCFLQLIQQLSGINTVMYYSATIVQMSGVGSKSTAIWLAAVTAFVNFFFTLVGVYLVEKIGRRTLTLSSLLGVTASLLFLSLGFFLSSIHSPVVHRHTPVTSNDVCYEFNDCNSCMKSLDCGYCYLEASKSNISDSWCYPINSSDPVSPINGLCSDDKSEKDLKFAPNYCPTKFSVMALIGMIAYLAFFAPGMGPMPWTINAEIYPQWARNSGVAYSTAVNWISNMIVSLTFLNLTQALTTQGAFLLYSVLSALGLLFLFLFLPETKGKRLEEIEVMFRTKWIVPCQRDNSYATLSTSYSSVAGADLSEDDA